MKTPVIAKARRKRGGGDVNEMMLLGVTRNHPSYDVYISATGDPECWLLSRNLSFQKGCFDYKTDYYYTATVTALESGEYMISEGKVGKENTYTITANAGDVLYEYPISSGDGIVVIQKIS